MRLFKSRKSGDYFNISSVVAHENDPHVTIVSCNSHFTTTNKTSLPPSPSSPSQSHPSVASKCEPVDQLPPPSTHTVVELNRHSVLSLDSDSKVIPLAIKSIGDDSVDNDKNTSSSDADPSIVDEHVTVPHAFAASIPNEIIVDNCTNENIARPVQPPRTNKPNRSMRETRTPWSDTCDEVNNNNSGFINHNTNDRVAADVRTIANEPATCDTKPKANQTTSHEIHSANNEPPSVDTIQPNAISNNRNISASFESPANVAVDTSSNNNNDACHVMQNINVKDKVDSSDSAHINSTPPKLPNGSYNFAY